MIRDNKDGRGNNDAARARRKEPEAMMQNAYFLEYVGRQTEHDRVIEARQISLLRYLARIRRGK